MKTFREELQGIFERQYTGLDDEMPEAEAEWFAELDPEQIIEWAETWAVKVYQEGSNAGRRKFVSILESVQESFRTKGE